MNGMDGVLGGADRVGTEFALRYGLEAGSVGSHALNLAFGTPQIIVPGT